ncbi:hypothetical protein Ac42p129 [Acinetobacter phage Ac42]|uniref:hypothetical protein n=1 Tax=Acinetobacter phage Ac42 TaxID=762660 RepID=UPI0001EBCD58|nr:hypothetical protein Ac42p129 [Acinetobacter phage Ac42]ADI96367.1 hypothetical protein Ac42p129 [Acinetobacter phage Ac42]
MKIGTKFKFKPEWFDTYDHHGAKDIKGLHVLSTYTVIDLEHLYEGSECVGPTIIKSEHEQVFNINEIPELLRIWCFFTKEQDNFYEIVK